MAYSPVASVIFSVRNGGKTSAGEIGRLPVTVGQAASVVKAASEYGNPFSRTLKEGLRILNSDKVVNKLGKVVKFASDNINPLIVVSSGIKVAMADKEKRKKTLIAEAGCLAGMFAGEGWMKKNLNKYLDQMPINKKWIPILKGIVFVTGSISCSLLGEKIGKKVANYFDDKSKKTTEQTQAVPVYNPLNYRA